MSPKARVIYWFRTDLRLHDSPALHAALDLKPEYVSASISKLNMKSKLFVIREAPQTVLPKLFKAWKITHLVFERDTDPYAKERDVKVIDLAREAGVEVVSTRHGRTLYDPDELVKANGGKPTMNISQVQH
ncbi:MAG: hypothetical protein Q9205_005607, partial [Flavoplaca limonia]